MSRAWIGLGANLGEREATLKRALEILERPGLRVVRSSSFIETEPVGCAPGQPFYLNGAAEVETSLSPRELLETLMDVERSLGRDRSSGERNQARTVDLDLLLFDDAIINEPHLIVPHPRLHERRFVLEPMAEIAPEVVHPILKKAMGEFMREGKTPFPRPSPLAPRP